MGRGKPKRPQRAVRESRLSDRLMRDAVAIVSEESVLEAERWASGWLGSAWSAAGLGEREPERRFHLEVVRRASTRPSPHGLAAVVRDACLRAGSGLASGGCLGQRARAVH